MTNIVNTVPYLRDQREFPEDSKELLVQLDKTYVDIANYVNSRTIGIYPSNKPAATGNKWFYEGNRHQTLRKVFSFTSTTSLTHGVDSNSLAGFVQMYGSYTDGTNWYAFIPGSTAGIANEIGFYLSSTDIVFTVGAGAPTLTQGFITIEWLSTI